MKRALAFVAYCALAGSTWLLDGLASAWPALLRLCIHDAMACLALLAAALLLKSPWPRMGWERVAGWGALLLAGPAVLFAGAGSSVTTLTETLVFTLVPAITVFLVAQQDQEAMGELLPALAGVGGLALMLPFSWPPTWFGGVWLAILIVCAAVVAVAGIKLHDVLHSMPLLWTGAIATGAASLLAGVGWAGFNQAAVAWNPHATGIEIGWGLLIDGPLTLLLLWLLREVQPVGAAARFTAVPLATILGGILMMRPALGWTTWLGIGLVFASGWMLLRGSAESDLESTGTPEAQR